MKANLQLNIPLILILFLCSVSSCVQQTKEQVVIFNVNAKGLKEVNTISVRGSIPPLNWSSNYELKDPDSDSIYSGRIVFDVPYDFIEVKFVKNENELELNNKPNRKLKFEEDQQTIFNLKFDTTD